MGLSFDGTDILKKPKLDFDRYRQWKKRQDERVGSISVATEGRKTAEARRAWSAMVPDVYKGATLDSVQSYDPAAAASFREYADMWMAGSKKNICISSNNGSRGKNWAMYAWLTELVDRGAFPDPQREIVIVNEAWMMDDLYGFSTREEAKARLLDEHVKMIAIDSIGRVIKSDSIAKSAWGMLKECISGRRLNLTCVADKACKDKKDMEVYMKSSVERMEEVGIWQRLKHIYLVAEPAGIRDMN